MKYSEVFREAALQLERGQDRFSCNAIDDIAGGFNTPARQYYSDLIAPEANDALVMLHDVKWEGKGTGAWGWYWGEEAGACRILALCFAAAVAESEGL